MWKEARGGRDLCWLFSDCDGTLNPSNAWKDEFNLAHSLRAQFLVAGSPVGSSLGQLAVGRKQRMNADAQLAFFLFSLGPHPREWRHPHLRWAFPPHN